MNITDKVLFTQSNASTYASGVDGRLVYNGIDGVDKKYVLEDEVPSGGTVPSSLTFGPAEIFSDSEGKFHIKFNCLNTDGDGYLDLCFYLHTNYDGGKDARCDLSYNKTEYPEEEDPYLNTRYIFRGGYQETGDSTYFTTNDFEENVEPGEDEYEDCPSCGEHLYRDGYCENCGYSEIEEPEEPEYTECPECHEMKFRNGECEECGYNENV